MHAAIRSMIQIDVDELRKFSNLCHHRMVEKKTFLSKPGVIPNEIFFIVEGLVRVTIIDVKGVEHTIHFALENQFIADYSCFIQKTVGLYTLECLEDCEVIVLPRQAIEWGYQNLKEGDKLGRRIAEYYFIYQDERIQNLYSRTPYERYREINRVFPKISERAPQHMIASYLGITSIHLSRLKRDALKS
ncbi:MAG: Crp/Fnr family transcriptional regulator [Flavobacteriia bacterium]|nr:Crp/Fnr family transcriptional regulator [Flavobacteriia bacterium]